MRPTCDVDCCSIVAMWSFGLSHLSVVATGELVAVLPIFAQGTGAVHSRVANSATNAGVVRASISIAGGPPLAITDSAGRDRLTAIQAGRRVVRVAHARRASACTPTIR